MLAFLIAGLITVSPATPAAQDAARDPAVQDVEIMRRLLVEAIGGASSDTSVRWSYDTPVALNQAELTIDGTVLSTLFSGASSVTHSRGFRAPGVGVLFTLDVQVPAVEATPEEPAAEDGEKKDAWDRVKREVQTGQKEADDSDPLLGSFYGRGARLSHTFASARDRRWTLDPEAIEAAVDAVLETLASHGQRIRDVDADEPITVALHFSPSVHLKRPALLSLEAGERTELANPWTSWVRTYGAGNAPPRKVVIQVPFSRLATINGGGKEELGQVATLHRY